MKTIFTSILAIATFSAMGAQAGTVLRLNAGTIDTKDAEARMSHILSSNAAAQDLIVQFQGHVTEAEKASLRAAGVEIFGYLPDDALMVRSTSANLQKWRAGHGVQAVLPLIAEYKLSSHFAPASVFNREAPQSIVIKTFKESDTATVAAALRAMPQAHVYIAEGKSILANIPRGELNTVAALQGIEHIQPYVEMKSMVMNLDANPQDTPPTGPGDYSDITGFETGTKVMNFDTAWAAGYTGKGQLASMADTGLDLGEGKYSDDFKGAIKDGFVFGLFSKAWEDPMGHGTHVAGSIVGRGTASGGKLHGGAYEAQFVAESMWSPMMNNLTVPSKISDLFDKAYADGARVHSNSWGAAANFGAYDNYASSVDEFMFNNPDMLILFAAGNSGTDDNKHGRIDPGSVSSPGTAKNALTVGASKNLLDHGGIQVPISKLRAAKDHWSAEPIYSSKLSDNVNGIAMFSSRGPTSDGRTKPDILAPGTNILSTRSHYQGSSDLWGAYNADYTYSGGTSMATPLTAGAATVTRQVLQEKFKIDSPSGALLKATMIHTAFDMFPGEFGAVGADHGQEILTPRPNSDEGYGRVDMTQVAQMNDSTHFVDNKVGVGEGEQQTVQVTLNKSGKITANLVYTDAPASPDASVALVNDLDLSLTKPTGEVVTPNDHVNNTELVELANLPAGTYQITVKGNRVPQGKNGKQPYALVYTAHED